MATKVVINACYGGFSLSEEAYKALGLEWDGFGYEFRDGLRADPRLVAVVEELGDAASGKMARLKIVEVPDGVDWYIDEGNGYERVTEEHETWS